MSDAMKAYATQYMAEKLSGKSPAEQCEIIIEVIKEQMEAGPNLALIGRALDHFNAENLYYLDTESIEFFRESARCGGKAVWGDFADGQEEAADDSSDDEDMVVEGEANQTIYVLASHC